MTLITDIRRNVTDSTPLMAMVGATDYAVERVRIAASNAGHLSEELEKALAQLEVVPRDWQARVREIDAKSMQQAPGLVVNRVKEMAGRVEDSYERLVERGKDLVRRARETGATQEFLEQSKLTLSRTRLAMATVRQVIDDTTGGARGVLTVGRSEVGEVADAVEAEVTESVSETEDLVAARTQGTRAAVRGAASTVRRRAATARTATRTAASSARKTAKAAVAAVEAVAGEIGEAPSTGGSPVAAVAVTPAPAAVAITPAPEEDAPASTDEAPAG